MAKRLIEINDTLQERVDSAIEDVKQELLNYLEENPDTDKVPCISNDLDYSGAIHEIVDGSVPIYNSEIDGLYFLYGRELDEAYENAGIGDGKEDNHIQVCIYCYIDQKVREWYDNNAEDIFNEWKEKRDKAIEDAREAGASEGRKHAETLEEYDQSGNPHDKESALWDAWNDAYEEAFDAVKDGQE